MNADPPIPERPVLRELIRKTRAREALTESDYRWITNVLVTLERDTMYALKERMQKYEAEEKRR